MEFFKFNRTRHIFDAGGNGVTRDDLVMSKGESEMFLKKSLFVIEEKVDGANIGFSIDKNFVVRAQNRSHYVNSASHKQFSTLDAWIEKHSQDLLKILNPPGKYILFGEWLFAKHSVYYTGLPGHFLAFDIFDTERNCYLNVFERNSIVNKGSSIPIVRSICQEEDITKERLLHLLDSKSDYHGGYVEGLVLRKIGNHPSSTKNNFFTDRAKLVRPDFLQSIEEQWTRQKFTKNVLTGYY